MQALWGWSLEDGLTNIRHTSQEPPISSFKLMRVKGQANNHDAHVIRTKKFFHVLEKSNFVSEPDWLFATFFVWVCEIKGHSADNWELNSPLPLLIWFVVFANPLSFMTFDLTLCWLQVLSFCSRLAKVVKSQSCILSIFSGTGNF